MKDLYYLELIKRLPRRFFNKGAPRKPMEPPTEPPRKSIRKHSQQFSVILNNKQTYTHLV